MWHVLRCAKNAPQRPIIIWTLRSIAQHVFASVAARQIEVFTVRMAHILHFFLQLNKMNFYSDGPKGFECPLDLCACS